MLMQLSLGGLQAGGSAALLTAVTDSGLLKLVHGLCLSTEDPRAKWARVVIEVCSRSSPSEGWTYDGVTGRIKNQHGICLDAAQRDVNAGKVHMWACEDGNPNQEWLYEASTGHVKSRHGRCLDAPQRSRAGSKVHMWECLAGEPNQQWVFTGRGARIPARTGGSCHTAQPGEACYVATTWAMDFGIASNPQWYPGLSRSSSFEDFQARLHSRGANGDVCPWPPCPASSATTTTTTTTMIITTTPTAAPRISAACSAAMPSVAEDGWSTGTCASRMEYYRRREGGSLSARDALARVALEYSACSPCWPWKKYKASGDTRISGKRGIAIQNAKLSASSLRSLAGVVSWGKIWDYLPGREGGPDLAAWASAGVRFVPMVWGGKNVGKAEAAGLPAGSVALLGFNEPNFAGQADLSPQRAAELWPRLERLAARAGIGTLVSPAVGLSQSDDPVEWLRAFLAACRGCKVDAVAFHSYTCYGRWLREHVDRFRVLGKPLWITEMACSDPQSPERLSMAGQMAYMREAIPLLEHDPDVHMYAWFSYFKDEWAFPVAVGANGDAGLVRADGSLSALGRLYASFATTEPRQPAAPSGGRSVQTAAAAARWLPADGGAGRACRGAHRADNSAAHYRVFPGTASLAACKARCAGASGCKGIEYSQALQRCEVWRRPSGIGATRPAPGFTCLRYGAQCRTAVPGEACYADALWARDSGIRARPEWYPGLGPASSLEDFQAYLYSIGANGGVCSDPPC